MTQVRVIIQKFGGTSLATDEAQGAAAGHVLRTQAAGWSPVVVVSAMGRTGAPYATDTLAGLVAESGMHPDRREMDLLLSCGEIIAGAVFAARLRSLGADAVALTGAQAGIVTNELHGDASIRDIRPGRLQGLLAEGKVPVVAGFQGASDGGEVTTLGRGGSDITAVALGSALHAELTEIYTDVDGVMTADPRMVPDAKTIPHMTYDETSYLAYEGAKVLHPRAVELAMRFGQPVRIRSTFADSAGTLVNADNGGESWAQRTGWKPVTGITHSGNLAHFSLTRGDGDGPPYTRTFRALADVGVNVDMISISPASCSFVVEGECAADAEKALRSAGVNARVRPGCAKVCVVGRLMRYVPGVMAQVSEALVDAGVDVLQTSDSLTTISCLVEQAQLQAAVQALHARFRLNQTQGGPQDQGHTEGGRSQCR